MIRSYLKILHGLALLTTSIYFVLKWSELTLSLNHPALKWSWISLLKNVPKQVCSETRGRTRWVVDGSTFFAWSLGVIEFCPKAFSFSSEHPAQGYWNVVQTMNKGTRTDFEFWFWYVAIGQMYFHGSITYWVVTVIPLVGSLSQLLEDPMWSVCFLSLIPNMTLMLAHF